MNIKYAVIPLVILLLIPLAVYQPQSAYAAIPVIEGSTNTNISGTSSTVNLPSGVSANDIIILVISLDGTAGNPQSSGGISMTQFGGTSQGTVELFYLWGRASGGETTQGITWTGNENGIVNAIRISGALQTGSPLDVIGTGSTGATTTLTPVSSASTVTNTLFISAVAVDSNKVAGADTVTGTGWTEVGTSASQGATSGAGIIVGSLNQATVANPADPVFGTWVSDGVAGNTFSIKEHLPPVYVVDLLSVYQSSSTTIGSGTAVCTAVDLEASPSSCSGNIEQNQTYRFEVTVRNDGTGAGSPTQLDFTSAVATSDTLGSIPVGNILNSGCSTNTDWTESIVTTTARASSGTACSISASGGTAVYWIIITIDTDAGTGSTTSGFDITDGAVSDSATTTTYTIIAGASPVYQINNLDVYESESTTLNAGNAICTAVTATCANHLIVGHTYRFEVNVSETAGSAGTPTTLDIDASVGDYDLLGNLVTSQMINSGCSTNTNWTESIVSTDARATSGTGCTINSSAADFWIIIRIDSAAGSGASPTATFTIDDGAVSDTSGTITFTVDNGG